MLHTSRGARRWKARHAAIDMTRTMGQQDDASDAVELLRAELDTVRWTSCDEAAKPLKAAGFSKKQIWAASKKVGVMRKKDGMKGGWMWRLRDATEVASG